MNAFAAGPLPRAARFHRSLLVALRLSLATVVLVLAACASPPRTAAPPQQTAGSPAANEWDQIVAAGKREGKVSIIAPQGTEARDLITAGFQARYPEIQIDVEPMAGNQIAPKLLNELSAGQAQTDLVLTGTTTVIESLRPADAVA